MGQLLSSLKDKKEKQEITHKDCTEISEIFQKDMRNVENINKFERKGSVIENYMVSLWHNNETIKEEELELIEDMLQGDKDIDKVKEKIPQASEEAMKSSLEKILDRFEEFEDDLPDL